MMIAANARVCRGAVPLATARGWFLGDWSAAYWIVFGISR